MTAIYCFGEALVDMVVGSNHPSGCLPMQAHAGGAPANVAVAAARLGANAHFLGPMSSDYLGEFLVQELIAAGVCLDTVRRVPQRTAIAWVTLSNRGERSFQFTREDSADMQIDFSDIDALDIAASDILHLSSNTLVTPRLREISLAAVRKFSERGAAISFDVNLRPALWPKATVDFAAVWELCAASTFVKAEREEWEALLDHRVAKQVRQELFSGATRLLTVTSGQDPVVAWTPNEAIELACPRVDAVDATGAGDAFCGALLAYLAKDSALMQALVSGKAALDSLQAMLRFAIAAGSLSVEKAGAFPGMPTIEQVQTRVSDSQW